MLRAFVAGVAYSICGVVLGSFALLIFVTKFDAWSTWWGLYGHLVMFSAAVGSVACLKSARTSFATRGKPLRDSIDQLS